MADAQACAAIVIHATKRHDAGGLAHLASIVGTRLRSIIDSSATAPVALTGTATPRATMPNTTISPAMLSDADVADLVRRSGAVGMAAAHQPTQREPIAGRSAGRDGATRLYSGSSSAL